MIETASPELSTAEPGARVDRAATSRAAAFRFAWTVYLLLHHSMVYWAWFRLRGDGGRRDIWGLGVGLLLWLVAALTLRFGASLRWFTLLLIFHLVYELPALPRTANHTFLTILMNLTMLATIAVSALRSGRGASSESRSPDLKAWAFADDARSFPVMSALLRLEVLAMYFFVVLHKLNTDYFNPAYSCATQLYADIARLYPFIPSGAWTDPLCIWGAIGCEAAIPVLLLFPRTRLAGVGLGLLFHLMLSPHNNAFIYSFSALLYAAYFLFLPRDVLAEMIAIWSRPIAWLRQRWTWLAAALLLGGAAAVLVRLLAPKFSRDIDLFGAIHPVIAAAVRTAWYVLALFNIYAFTFAILRRGGLGRRLPTSASDEPHAPLFRPAFTTPLLIFPLLVVFNGFCPYLGLKTESAFAMYANIRTEGSVNNHLFMPRIDLANYQADIVEIIDSSEPQLRDLRRSGELWTFFEFRKKLSRNRDKNFHVTFRRNAGPPITLTRRENADHEAFRPPHWLERKLLYFRDVQVGASPQHCGH